MPGMKIREYPVARITRAPTTTINTTLASAAGVNIPSTARDVMVRGAALWYCSLGPKIRGVFKTSDAGVTYVDYTSEATDNSATTYVTLSSLPTAANGGYLYVIFSSPAYGIYVDVTNANGTASALTGYFWDGITWTNSSLTDGNGATCFAADMAIYWTMPTTWKEKTIDFAGTLTGNHKSVTGYPMRFQVAAALDSDTTLCSIVAMPDVTTYPGGYMAATTDYVFSVDPEVTGSIIGVGSASTTFETTFIHYS